jgi:hypothetical protein
MVLARGSEAAVASQGFVSLDPMLVAPIVRPRSAFLLAQTVAAQTWTREVPGTFLWSDPANWTAAPVCPDPSHIRATDAPYVAQNDLASPFVLNRLTSEAAQGRITGAPTFVGTAALPPQSPHPDPLSHRR